MLVVGQNTILSCTLKAKLQGQMHLCPIDGVQDKQTLPYSECVYTLNILFFLNTTKYLHVPCQGQLYQPRQDLLKVVKNFGQVESTIQVRIAQKWIQIFWLYLRVKIQEICGNLQLVSRKYLYLSLNYSILKKSVPKTSFQHM